MEIYWFTGKFLMEMGSLIERRYHPEEKKIKWD